MNQLQQQLIRQTIQRQMANTREKWQEFAADLFKRKEHYQFNQTLYMLSDTLVQFNNNFVKKCLIEAFEQTLKHKTQTFKQFKDKTTLFSKNQSQILVKNEKRQQQERIVMEQWKQARKNFFTYQIKQKCQNAKVPDQEQQQIIALLKQKQLQINLQELGALTKYANLVIQLIHSLKQIQQKFQRKSKECLPLQQILKFKLDSLKVIHIEYPYKNNEWQYEISAFDLFKVVHSNPLLSEVTIKGVLVNEFQSFIQQISALGNNNKVKHQRNQLVWIKHFKPPKSLKLTINAQLEFNFQNKDQSLLKINNLEIFCDLFDQLGDIFITIEGIFRNQPHKDLSGLWKCLKKIKTIKIKIIGSMMFQINKQGTSNLRFLFGELVSFTQITYLAFQYFHLIPTNSINDILAIEEILITLFKNNAVNHLQLISCSQFPVIPYIKTLQSVSLLNVSFRKYDFLRESLAGPSLRYINCNSSKLGWRIDDHLLNQLQTLIIWNCRGIYLGNISQQPSNIKHLQLQDVVVGSVDSLSLLFPKLINLTYLQLNWADCSHQLICTIPSPHLQELHIGYNKIIKNNDLQVIDKNWPQLKILQMWDCDEITVEVWSVCKFEGLIEINIDNRNVLGYEYFALHQLKTRGIRVIIND